MAKFTVEHSSKKGSDETYKLVKEALATEIKKFDANAKCIFDDNKKTCQISGGQFKAEMQVADSGANSQLNITVDLPFLLMPLKGKIQESLKKMLNRHLS